MATDKSQSNSAPQPIPQRIINQLSEYTLGGFALFYFNPETGFPTQLLSLETPAHSLAIQKYMLDWGIGLQNAYRKNVEETFLNVMDQAQLETEQGEQGGDDDELGLGPETV
jgi:hypothetical protein